MSDEVIHHKGKPTKGAPTLTLPQEITLQNTSDPLTLNERNIDTNDVKPRESNHISFIKAGKNALQLLPGQTPEGTLPTRHLKIRGSE